MAFLLIRWRCRLIHKAIPALLFDLPVRNAALNAYAHQELPFSKARGGLQPSETPAIRSVPSAICAAGNAVWNVDFWNQKQHQSILNRELKI